MDDLKKFIRLIRKYRIALIVAPLLAVTITYFLVRNLPNSYTSQARISTGLVDQNKGSDILNISKPQGQELVQKFSSLVETAQMKSVLDRVTMRLLIHDFSQSPFLTSEDIISDYSEGDKKKILEMVKEQYVNGKSLNEWDKQAALTINIAKKLKYDATSLKDALKVYRAGDSDYIVIEAEANDPQLSAYIANTLSEEFIRLHDRMLSVGDTSATNLLQRLIAEKRRGLDKAVDSLKRYKIKNRVLNLNEQAKQLYGQILNYDDKKHEILKDVASTTGALTEIDRKFSPSERKYIESKLIELNTKITDTKDVLQRLYDKYYQSNLDKDTKARIDSTERVLEHQISASSDNYLYNPLTTKGELITERLKLAIKYDISKFSLQTVQREILRLNQNFDNMVPHEAFVQSLERDVDVASSEYLDMLNKLNQQSLQSEFHIRLEIAQIAQPGTPIPNKKMLLVLISGVISVFFGFVVIFILFYFDDSINSKKELVRISDLPVIGLFNKLPVNELDFQSLWNRKAQSQTEHTFKENLRSLRFELDNAMLGNIVSVSSIQNAAGKTFSSLSLAYAINTTQRSVLLIDGNFQAPQISKLGAANAIYIDDYLRGLVDINAIKSSSLDITVLANKAADISVFELERKEVIVHRMRELAAIFDVILIDTPTLSNSTLAREWISLSDSLITVFDAGKNIIAGNEESLDYLKEIDKKFAGWLINKVDKEA